MASELMLLNPAKRPSKRRKANPAQLRALAAGRRKRALATNPAQRKRRRKIGLRVSGAPVSRRRARRNPIGSPSGGGIVNSIVNAGISASGALAVDAFMTYAPLPASLSTGYAKHATKAALALALGIFGRKILGRTAAKMSEGALTVIAYTAAKEMLAGAGMNLAYMSPAQSFNPAPQIGMSGVAEYVNMYQNSGMGEYVY
jgi:hypothetical protein